MMMMFVRVCASSRSSAEECGLCAFEARTDERAYVLMQYIILSSTELESDLSQTNADRSITLSYDMM